MRAKNPMAASKPKRKDQGRRPEVGLRPLPQGADGPVTALDLPQGELSPAMRAYFAKCEEKIGFVPNVLRAYAHDNAKLEAFAAFYNDLMLAPSGLSKLEREMIAVAVSSRNRCSYCLVAHGAAVRQLSGDPALGEFLAMNYVRRTSRRGTGQCWISPCKMTERLLRPSRRQIGRRCARSGFSRSRHLGHRGGRGFFNMSNRMASAVDMRPNHEYHGQAR